MVFTLSLLQKATALVMLYCLVDPGYAAPSSGIPSIISSRTKQPDLPSKNFNVESANMKANKDWYEKHGGSFNFTKRDTSTIAGLTTVVPPDAPSMSLLIDTSTSGIAVATTAQTNAFTKYAGIAATAYCSDVTDSMTWTCDKCQTYAPDGNVIATFDTSFDTVGFVMRSDSDKTIYLVFRGSKTIANWITNLNFGFTDYSPVSGAEVHSGFYNAAKGALTSYFPVIQRQLTSFPSYKVVVTGHSLGGALALLTGMDLYQRDLRLSSSNLAIYTVGSPRVGNPTFAYYVQSTGITVSRSVNKRDIVPHLPPASFDFFHPGVEAWTEDNGSIQICTSSVETSLCSNTIVPFTSISDHLAYYNINEGSCK